MKKFLTKFKKLRHFTLLEIVEHIIEHKLFKPVAICIITSFVIFRSSEILLNFVANHREEIAHKAKTTAVKINLIGDKIGFDFEEEQVLEHRVKSGETMLQIIAKTGASEQDSFAILEAMKKVFDMRKVGAGDQIVVKYKAKIDTDSSGNVDRSVVITAVEFAPSVEEELKVSRKADGSYEAVLEKLALTKHIAKYHGVIKEGLFSDGVAAGISPTTMMNMINLYSFDVDFQRDIHDGDKFEMLIESFYAQDGRKVKDGNVIFSSLTLSGKSIDIYMHRVDGKAEYFDDKGNSVRKSLLRTPINGARVSSGFGMRRHPVLGYSKMHKGTDFAAPTGTPILAAGNGTISYYGVKGGYGNYVQIKHNSEYATAYGHASRFVKKLHVGSKVKQGEVIAYVGTTGRSTGPHLHFEVLVKGVQINPAKVKATSGLRLGGKELARFKSSKAEIDGYRKNMPNQLHQ